MIWLLHGNLSAALGEALVRHRQEVRQYAQLELPAGAAPMDIVKAVEKRQWDVITTDDALPAAVYARRYPFSRTIVYLQFVGGEVEQDDAIDRLFRRYKRLSPRRLYTLTATRVKIRQLPATRTMNDE